jgi:hypothetical protein
MMPKEARVGGGSKKLTDFEMTTKILPAVEDFRTVMAAENGACFWVYWIAR